MDTMIVTKRILETIISDNGGITNAALQLLGETNRRKGWKKHYIGKEIDKQAYDSFIASGAKNPKKKRNKRDKQSSQCIIKEEVHIRIGRVKGVLPNQKPKWWACELREHPVSQVSCNYVWGDSKEEVMRKKGLLNGGELPLWG